MPSGRPPVRRWVTRWAAATALVVAAARLLPGPEPAGAVVEHGDGFAATVAGWTSWYGSYHVGASGTGWCIDHGSRAPDAAFGYAPTTVDDQPAATRTAVAWLVGRYGLGAAGDPVASAGIMLAAHDLMGATYPYGRLDVDAMDERSLAGFGSAASAVLAAARADKADAVAHSVLVAPAVLHVDAPPVDVGAVGTMTATLIDAVGTPITGIDIAPSATGATLADATPIATDTAGAARFAFTAALGTNALTVTATLPDLTLHAYASTTVVAQRVAVPATTDLHASTTFDVEAPHGTITIRKTGDDLAYLPITGARFTVDDAAGVAVGELVIPDGGASAPLTLPPGSYHVIESAPPAGYLAAGPWTVDVIAAGDAVLAVRDHAQRGRLRVLKVDAVTNAPVGGARLQVAYDADHDGTYETVVATLTSAATAIEVGDLLPGAYRLRELDVPSGYEPATKAVKVDVGPGQELAVSLADAPLPTTTTTSTTSTTTTSTTTTMPATTTSTLSPTTTSAVPATVLGAPPVERPPLPRTGADAITPLVLLGFGLVLLGGSVSACCRCGPGSSGRAGATRSGRGARRRRRCA